MKKRLLVGLVTGLFLVSSVSLIQAATINFDLVSTQFFINGITEGDFDINRTDDGLATMAAGYAESYWRGNGTGRLLSFTNNGETSGFRLDSLNGDLFSLESFDFANGYVSQSRPVLNVILTGTFSNGSTIVTNFVNNSSTWQTASLSSSWVGLQSVEFTAHGYLNRTVWDNIIVDDAAPVPEPATMLLLGTGLASLVGMRRRKNKK